MCPIVVKMGVLSLFPALEEAKTPDFQACQPTLDCKLTKTIEKFNPKFSPKNSFVKKHVVFSLTLLIHVDPGTSVARRDIMASLKLDYNHNTAARLFLRAVYKGILDERDNRYVIPIPSMHNWLVDNFSRIQEPIFPPHSSMPMGFDSRDRGLER